MTATALAVKSISISGNWIEVQSDTLEVIAYRLAGYLMSDPWVSFLTPTGDRVSAPVHAVHGVMEI